MRPRLSPLVAAVLAVAACPAAVPAQEIKDALQVVPKEALGFAVVARPAEASARAAELIRKVGVSLPVGPLELLKLKLGAGKSLDEKAAAVVAILPGGDGPPVPLLFLPVRDYKQFLKEVKAEDGGDGVSGIKVDDVPVAIAPKGKYAVLTIADAAVLKRALAGAAGVGAEVAPLQDFLREHEVAAVVTSRGVKRALEEYRKQLKDLPGFAPPAGKEGGPLGALEKGLAALESGVKVAALGVKVGEGGDVHVHARARFEKGGELAKAAASFQGTPGGPLAGLPARPFGVALGGPIPEAFMKSMGDLTNQMFLNLPMDMEDEKLRQVMREYAELMRGLRGMGMMMASGGEEAGLYPRMIVVTQVADAPGYVGAYGRVMRGMMQAVPGGAGNDVVKIADTKVGGRAAVEITLNTAQNLPPDTQKMMEAMFGPGGRMTVTAAALDRTTVLQRYVSAADLGKLLAKDKGKGLAALPEVARAAALLPAGAQWAMYVDPAALAETFDRFAPAFGLQVKPLGLPKAPLMGVGLKVGGDGLEGHALLPARSLEAMGRLVRHIQAMMPAAKAPNVQ